MADSKVYSSVLKKFQDNFEYINETEDEISRDKKMGDKVKDRKEESIQNKIKSNNISLTQFVSQLITSKKMDEETKRKSLESLRNALGKYAKSKEGRVIADLSIIDNAILQLSSKDKQENVEELTVSEGEKKAKEAKVNEDAEEEAIFDVDDESEPYEEQEETEDELVELVGEEEKSITLESIETLKKYKMILLDENASDEFKSATYEQVKIVWKEFQSYASKRAGEILKLLNNPRTPADQKKQLQIEFDEIYAGMETLREEVVGIEEERKKVEEKEPEKEEETTIEQETTEDSTVTAGQPEQETEEKEKAQKTKAKKNAEPSKNFSNEKTAEAIARMEQYKRILSDGRGGNEWKNVTYGEVIRLRKSFQEYASRRSGEILKEIDNPKTSDEQKKKLQAEFDEIYEVTEILKKEISEIRKKREEKKKEEQPKKDASNKVTDRIIEQYERCKKVLSRSNLSDVRKKAAEEEMKRIQDYFREHIDKRKSGMEQLLEDANISEGAKRQLQESARDLKATAEKLGMSEEVEKISELIKSFESKTEEKKSTAQVQIAEKSEEKVVKEAPEQVEKKATTEQKQTQLQPSKNQVPTAQRKKQPETADKPDQQQDQSVKQGSFRDRVKKKWKEFIDTEKELSKAERGRNFARIKLGGVKSENVLRKATQDVRDATNVFFQAFVNECRAKGESILTGIDSIIKHEQSKADKRIAETEKINKKIDEARGIEM